MLCRVRREADRAFEFTMTNRDVYACLFVGEGVLRAATERRHEATGNLPRMSVSGHVRCCTTPDHKVVM